MEMRREMEPTGKVRTYLLPLRYEVSELAKRILVNEAYRHPRRSNESKLMEKIHEALIETVKGK
jgi:hypothetical protein